MSSVRNAGWSYMVNDIVLIVLPLDFSEEYRKRNWRYESGIISKDSYSGHRRFSFGTAFISKALLMAGFTPVVFDAFTNMWIGKNNYPMPLLTILQRFSAYQPFRLIMGW